MEPAGNMRGNHCPGLMPEGMACGQRFRVGDVEGGPRRCPRLQGAGERIGIDGISPPDI